MIMDQVHYATKVRTLNTEVLASIVHIASNWYATVVPCSSNTPKLQYTQYYMTVLKNEFT